ncbi:MAG: hypothetical protein HOP28_05215 [Gemmatimonadales bacterium]|nr:hypothetical protein [Gemmatimonadales bacterium]
MTRRPTLAAHFAAIALVALGLACGKEGPAEPRVATRIEIVAGANQSGQVGNSLPVKLVVRTSDGEGPVGGVTVTFTPESGADGTTSPRSVTTGTDGTGQATWTLGSKVGTQTLSAVAPGIPSAVVSATGQLGPPIVVLALSTPFQLAVVSRAVTAIPSVQVTDAFGNPIAGAQVIFEAQQLQSVLTGAIQTTNAAGQATLGSWTIGPNAVSYSVVARLPNNASATFQAQGVPAAVTIVAGADQAANTGTAVAVLPTVRASRDDGSPIPNVPVSFVVTAGGGAVTGTSVLTAQDGTAKPAQWVLGAAPGANRVEALFSGAPPLVFTATGIAAAPAALAATSALAQSGFFGNYLPTSPSVAVTDAGGMPVAGAPVTYSVLSGDGQIVGATAVTDFLGRATLGSWRLGAAAQHSVRATVGALPPLTFTAAATAPPASTFKIDIRYLTPVTPVQQAAFELAVTRWTQILLAGQPPYPVNEQANSCFTGMPAMNETIDGVVIFASLVPIDGPGQVLGSAGPCIVRDDPTYGSAVGLMRFDTADLTTLENQGALNAVILHEMAHVLGFGSLWNFLQNQLLTGEGTASPSFNGPAARNAFLGAIAPSTVFTGTPVPVEGSFGPGTRDSHWRETSFSNELMTGFLNSGFNPLSAISAATFRDLGYLVNDAATEPYTFLATLLAGPPGAPVELREEPLTSPLIVIDRRGRTVARIPRF